MSSKSKKGFTIIEVVLVLAIAGLIFLMVFIALPALQRSQRNTQRSDDLSRVLTAINSYQSNNNGRLPFTHETDPEIDANFVARYIDDQCTTDDGGAHYENCVDQFTDPDGQIYGFNYVGDVADEEGEDAALVEDETQGGMDHLFHVYTNATCGANEGHVDMGTGTRQVAIIYFLEGGAITCNDNH